MSGPSQNGGESSSNADVASVPSRRRRALALAAALVLALVAVMGIDHCRQPRNVPTLPFFPLVFLEGAEPFARLAPPTQLDLRIRSVSADGKWLCVFERGGVGGTWFFDLEQQTFVAEMRRPSPVPHGALTPVLEPAWNRDSLLVVSTTGDQSIAIAWLRRLFGRAVPGLASASPPVTLSYFEADALQRVTRFQFAEPMGTGAALLRGAFRNRSRTLIAYQCARQGGPKTNATEFVVRDLSRKRSPVLSRFTITTPLNSWPYVRGWLPDDKTLVIREYRSLPSPRIVNRPFDSLYLVEAGSKKPPRRVPIVERFERLAEKGDLAAGEEIVISTELTALIDEGQTARLIATFGRKDAPFDLRAHTSSMWDLDVETGELTRRMDLERGAVYPGSSVFSPSGRSIVTPLTTPTVALATQPTSVGLLLYTIGQPPKRLPFEIIPQSELYLGSLSPPAPSLPPSRYTLPAVPGNLRFLDDDTIIHTGNGSELWTFDVRTSESTLLWRPKRDTSKPQ